MTPKNITTLPVRHSWPVSLSEAAALQRRLAPLVRTRRFCAGVRLLAGADAAYLPEKNLGYKWTIGLEEGMKSLVEWRQTKRFFS